MLNTRKQRNALYAKTFHKWGFTRIFQETLSSGITLAQAANGIGEKATNEELQTLVEAIADVDVLKEVLGSYHSSFEDEINKYKKDKLVKLLNSSEHIQKANEYLKKAKEEKEQAIQATKKIKLPWYKRIFASNK